ncbi:MAG: helix-turn-helix domain-containing protein [Bacillota bacterium]|nr:helix-turn-helix domain-containing protein [Bacillota bacterium]
MKLEKLQKKRKDKGFTREQIAEFISVSKYTYKSYELGARPLKAETLKKISIILGCTMDDLM